MADAYVDATNADTNFGSSTSLRTRVSPVQRSYLRFVVPANIGAITSATLRMYAKGNANGYRVSRTDGSWTELGITYNNMPAAIGTPFVTSGAVISGTYNAVDVSSALAAVGGSGQVDLLLDTTNTSSVPYDSKEGANRPQLVIQTGAVAAPTSTPVPTATATATATPTSTPTNTPVPLPTVTETATATSTPTNTPVPPTDTPVPLPTATDTATATSTPINTPVPVPTDTPVPTATATATATETPTATPVPPPSDTPAPLPTATDTATATSTPEPPPTDTPVPTATDTAVPASAPAFAPAANADEQRNGTGSFNPAEQPAGPATGLPYRGSNPLFLPYVTNG